MPTNYIKVRPAVAKKLGVAECRCAYPDGNVMLWEKDLSLVDPAWPLRVEATVARIGGVLFDPYSNHDEVCAKAEDCTPLPIPTDPEYAAVCIAAEIEEEAEEIAEELAEDLAEEVETELEEELEEEQEGGES